jgi:hypothetical protein
MGVVSIGKDFLVWGVVRGEVQGKRRVSVQRRRYGHEESQAWAWEGRKNWTCGRLAVSILCRDGRPGAATRDSHHGIFRFALSYSHIVAS